MHYHLEHVLVDILQWDSSELLKRMQAIQLRMIEETARTMSHRTSVQNSYIEDNKSKLVTRMTLYNVLNGKHKPSSKVALLLRTAINEALKSRNLKPVTYDDIGIDIYKR